MESTTLKKCSTSSQLKQVFDLITNYKTTMNHYSPPYNDMRIETTGRIKTTYINGLELWYLPHRYEETINRKDFGLEMFWSSVGGFVGMFLGFSLLQLPDLISKL